MKYWILGLVLFAFGVTGKESKAQVWLKVTPLESSRNDVTKIQSGEQRLADGSSYFDLENESVTIKYYENTCAESDAQPSLSSGVVIQIKSEPKNRTFIGSLLGFSKGSYEKIAAEDSEVLYIDHDHGFVIIAQRQADNTELVKSFFYVPKTHLLSRCLLNELDVTVRNGFEKSTKWNSGERTDFYDHIQLTNGKLSSASAKSLELFANALRQSPRSSGVVYVYANDQSDGRKFWIKELRTHLIEKLSINGKRFEIIDAGRREQAVALLIVVTKNSR